MLYIGIDHASSKMGQYIEEISLKKSSDLRPVSKTLSSDSAISNGSSSEGLSDKVNQVRRDIVSLMKMAC